jgi:hypothetical protein
MICARWLVVLKRTGGRFRNPNAGNPIQYLKMQCLTCADLFVHQVGEKGEAVK